MTSFLLKDEVHSSLAESVYNEFISRRAIYHYFIGNILEWDLPFEPEFPKVTGDYERFTRNGILTTQKVNLRDISFVVPRIDWVSGTVYDQYDENYSPDFPAASGAVSLKSANF